MHYKRAVVIVTLLAVMSEAGVQAQRTQRVAGRELVPDSETAQAIALAVASARYGKQVISEEKPLRVERDGAFWSVRGTMPEGFLGGVVVVKIRAQTGCVEYLGHSK